MPENKSCPHCVKHKNTPRSEEMQADLQKRLNRAIGQLNGIKQMIDDNRYCGDVLVQLSATRRQRWNRAGGHGPHQAGGEVAWRQARDNNNQPIPRVQSPSRPLT